MLNTFKYVALSLIRDKGIIIWALVFPLVLSTCFNFMFAGIDQMGQVEPVRVVVVEDQNYEDATAFKAFMEATSEVDASDSASANASNDEDDDQIIFEVIKASSASEALDLVLESSGDASYAGFITVTAEGLPEVHAKGIASDSVEGQINLSLLTVAMDAFVSQYALASDLLQKDPSLFTDPAFVQSLFEIDDLTDRVAVTQNAPKESVRYFFALLGMAALFGAQAGLQSTAHLLPNLGPLGARREIGATSHAKALTGTLLASWAVSFVCLCIAFAFMLLIGNVDFAGRIPECILVIAVTSLMATALGAFFGSLPKVSLDAKFGILTALVCFCALFAGLYGQPTMALADMVDEALPIASLVNPAKQVSDAFFSLMYYDTLGPLFAHLATLLAMALILFGLSAMSLRRQRYASI